MRLWVTGKTGDSEKKKLKGVKTYQKICATHQTYVEFFPYNFVTLKKKYSS